MIRPYFDVPRKYKNLRKARFVILPIPYEQTTSYVKGTEKGPQAIREASAQVELFDEETGVEPYLEGIYSAPPVLFGRAKDATALDRGKRAVTRYVERGKFVIALGGEHSITAGIVPVYRRMYHDLSVLQIDAHPDLRNSYEGNRYNHACVGSRILEIAPLVQVGVRSWCAEEEAFMKEAEKKNIRGKKALTVFPMQKIRGSKNWITNVVNSLSRHVYLTLDLDGLDPSVIPAVGTPEPGGLAWQETLDLLKAVIKKRKLVGMDMVELSPIDGQFIGDFAAARLLYKILAYCVKG